MDDVYVYTKILVENHEGEEYSVLVESYLTEHEVESFVKNNLRNVKTFSRKMVV